MLQGLGKCQQGLSVLSLRFLADREIDERRHLLVFKLSLGEQFDSFERKFLGSSWISQPVEYRHRLEP